MTASHILCAFAILALPANVASAACKCAKPKDVATMQTNSDGKYTYVDGNTTYTALETYGSTCIDAIQGVPAAVSDVSWGCNAAEVAKPTSWCHNKWCYVNACDCAKDYGVAETMQFTGAKGLYFSYDLCCQDFTTKVTCAGKGAGECKWNAQGKCRMAGTPIEYLNTRCKAKGKDKAACAKFTSCKWDTTPSTPICTAASEASREASLGCSTGVSSAMSAMLSGLVVAAATAVLAAI